MANPNPVGGSRKGIPNKATSAAREAIALFVDNNASRLQDWLDQVAAGVWSDEEGKYVVPPNPERAFNMFQSVVEYHIPKLARTDVSLSGEVTVKTFNVKRVKAEDGNPVG